MKPFFSVLFFALALAGCSKPQQTLPYYNTPDFTPRWDVKNRDTFHKIRPFSLVTQEGKTFTEKDLEGKICVADFFFTTCPGICPKMTKSMEDIQAAFKEDNAILLLSHSVTPEDDSVPVLQQYAVAHKVDANRWKLLTGAKKEIYNLGRNYYFVEEAEGVTKGDDVFLHTENFILLDKGQHIRGIYNGLDPNSMEALVRDIKVLKEE